MNAKVMAIVLIVTAAALFSGFIMYQTLTSNNSSYLPEENLELSNQHAWYNQSGWAEAAIAVVNVGERDTILRKITIQSIESKWSDVYYWRTDTGPISNELKQTPNELSGSSFSILVDGQQRSFQQASSELALNSGWTIVLYVMNPGNLTAGQHIANQEVTIAVFSVNKLYYEQASLGIILYTPPAPPAPPQELKVLGHTWAMGNTAITLTVKNTGTETLTIVEVRINDVKASSVTYISGNASLQAGGTATLRIASIGASFTSGVKYEFAVLTAAGNKYTYAATAP